MAKKKESKKEKFLKQFKDYNGLIIILGICTYVLATIIGGNMGSGSCSPICMWSLGPVIAAWSIATAVVFIVEIICFVNLAKYLKDEDKIKLVMENVSVIGIICLLFLLVFKPVGLLFCLGSGIVNVVVLITSDVFFLRHIK